MSKISISEDFNYKQRFLVNLCCDKIEDCINIDFNINIQLLKNNNACDGFYDFETQIVWINENIIHESKFDYLLFVIAHEIRHAIQAYYDIMIKIENKIYWKNKFVANINTILRYQYYDVNLYNSLPWESDANAFALSISQDIVIPEKIKEAAVLQF